MDDLKDKIDTLAMELQRDLVRLLTMTPMDELLDILDQRIARFRLQIDKLFENER